MVKRKVNKKGFDLKKEYFESWKYIKSSKIFIWAGVAIFIFFFLIGFFVPAPEVISKSIFEFIKEIVEKTQGLSGGELISFIFFNNFKASFFGMIFGLAFGIFPIFSTIINGYLVGFVSSFSVQTEGVVSLWRLLPHGIFELPAIFISFGLGIRMGISLFNKKKFGNIKDNLISSLKTFVLIIIPLLVIAAIIEGILIFLSI